MFYGQNCELVFRNGARVTATYLGHYAGRMILHIHGDEFAGHYTANTFRQVVAR